MLVERDSLPPEMFVELTIESGDCEPKRLIQNNSGNIQLWIQAFGEEHDLSIPDDLECVLGADVSAGTGASNSVASVINRRTNEKVAVFKTPFMEPKPFARHCIALAKLFNKAKMIWDASGPTGKIFTGTVIDSGYSNIYYRQNEKKISKKITDEPGYYLNPVAKYALLEDYRDALSDKNFINRSKSGLEECLQFIRKPDGSVEHSAAANAQDPSGARSAHGDEVIADALASHLLQGAKKVDKPKKPEVPYGSLKWRQNQATNAQRARQADTLGVGW